MLRNDPCEVLLTRQPEQPLSVILNMIAIRDRDPKKERTKSKALGISFKMFPTIPPEVLLAIWLPLAGCVMALCLYDEEEDEDGTP